MLKVLNLTWSQNVANFMSGLVQSCFVSNQESEGTEKIGGILIREVHFNRNIRSRDLMKCPY